MAGVGFSRTARLVAAGAVGFVTLLGLPAAGAAPTPPATTSPPAPPTTTPGSPSTPPPAPPKPMAADRSHPVFAPDGCPTVAPENTVRGLPASKSLSLYEICRDSVAAARTPAAAIAIRFALAELGTPYSQAQRNSPHIYDCSSFVSRAYQAAGVPIAYPDTPSRIDGGPGQNTPGSRAEVVAPWSVPVTPLTALPGDLVFFPGADPPNGHVGMLLADGLFVHTNASGDVAHVGPLEVAKVTAWQAVDPTKVTTTPDPDATERARAEQEAQDRYQTAVNDIARIKRELVVAGRKRDRAVRDLLAAQRKQTVATQRREAARRKLQRVAVVAYMQGGLADNPAMLLSAKSMNALGRDQALLSAVGENTRGAIAEYERARDAAVSEQRDLQQSLDRIDARIRDGQRAVTEAQSVLAAARTDPAGPILGPAQLSAADLVAWYRSTGQRTLTSVPIDVLAQLFISEGNRAGVRGDVAFAEAALDTTGFTFPPTGALSGRDNGLSLLGGCDSCRDAPWFASAQLAVRAQTQLLRVFADATVAPTSLRAALVIPGVLDPQAKGAIKSWGQLPGMLLHAPDYGTTIMNQYRTITDWVATHPAKPSTKP